LSYPLLTLFRSFLLGIWYQLSDVQLAQCLYRDLLFRAFFRLELGGNVPEATTLGRSRSQLVKQDLWGRLLYEVNRKLDAKNIIMTQGRVNIIDATQIEAAQSDPGNGVDGKPKKDSDAGWHVKNDSRGNKKSTFGFSVHTGVDEDGFIHRQSVTAGNVYDSQERDTLLLGDEVAPYADAAYSSMETRNKLAQLIIQSELFNEAEFDSVLEPEVEDTDDATIEVPAHTRKRGGRKALPAELPRIEVVCHLSDDEKVCDQGHALKQISEKTSE
jgi:IS5 family transposase